MLDQGDFQDSMGHHARPWLFPACVSAGHDFHHWSCHDRGYRFAQHRQYFCNGSGDRPDSIHSGGGDQRSGDHLAMP